MMRGWEDVILPAGPDDKPGLGLVLEPTDRRIRAVFDGIVVADSRNAFRVRAPRRLPVYYFPLVDVKQGCLSESDHKTEPDSRGPASWWHLAVGARRAENAAWTLREATGSGAPLVDYVAFYWNVMDAWLEEDEEVIGHPRDPLHRVDTRLTSRHVQFVIGGEILADTRSACLVLETHFPPRLYVPKADVRMSLLKKSERTSTCAYKGHAVYWHAELPSGRVADAVWSYPSPTPECAAIANRLAIFDHVGSVIVDGAPVAPRPR